MNVKAMALDLGSTRLKLAAFLDNGQLKILGSRAFPELSGSGVSCEVDPSSFRDRVTALFAKTEGYDTDLPLGVSVQRSSFLLWDRATGKPLTRILSWQDRSGQRWCSNHTHLVPKLWHITGLPLTAHYAGPKLANLLASDQWLAALARRGKICFGTLETYLAWQWSGGEVFQTDPGMAARTQMMDIHRGEWSDEILREFAIPREILPAIAPFSEVDLKAPDRRVIAAMVPDQTAAALPCLHGYPNAVVVNSGTGSFSLRLGRGQAPNGFLTGPIDGGPLNGGRVFWEGPVNAGAALWKRWKTTFSEDVAKTAAGHAAPERHGWGAPYWRSDLGQINTETKMTNPGFGLGLLQGYAFRLRQVIAGLFPENQPEKVLLGGGLIHDPNFANFLSRYLPFPLFRMEEPELSLWGAGWLADGCRLQPNLRVSQVDGEPAQWADAQYPLWCAWMKELLDS